jgi:hypothetical protein
MSDFPLDSEDPNVLTDAYESITLSVLDEVCPITSRSVPLGQDYRGIMRIFILLAESGDVWNVNRGKVALKKITKTSLLRRIL